MTRKGSGRGWKHAAVTAVVAYALALQALLLAFGGALHAAEAFGSQAILCAPGGASGQDRDTARTHDVLCCTLSCHGSTAAGPLPVFSILRRPAPPTIILKASGEVPVLRSAPHVLPLGSRAPPRLG